MLLSDLVTEVHMAITSNKVRTGLTVLGIVIGIASVIVMIAIGNGSQKAIQESIQSIGSNLLTIQPGRQRSFGDGPQQGSGSAESLTRDDADAIAEEIDGIAAVAPTASGNQQIIAEGNNAQSSVTGVTAQYAQVNNITVASGTFIGDVQESKRSKIVVIGPDIRDDLYGEGAVAVGKKMRIGGLSFTVIGVTKSKGGGGFGNSDEVVYMPLSTYQQYFSGSEYLSSISVSVADQDRMTQVEEDIQALLLKRHKINNVDDADFNIRNQEDILEMTSSITGTLTLLLGAVAGISLVVGGIGIMNMMLTTVTERTREIGLRKSIGANQKDIRQQFLFESMTLTFIGGVIGIALGITVAFALDYFDVTTTQISSFSIILSFSVSAAIGIIFGYYPARRAASLNPIHALRYE
ncbi:MAG: ABC transporter permease [Parcubacteria group bacterium]|jgi:putative ABC transport system permease protein